MKVRTCVYAIALNEIKFVDEFMRHCEGADLVLVCDTGSTDGTAERLRELGATVYDICQRPWRFDVPRNTALNLIPADIDICLSIDLDEFLQPGWAQAIDREWQARSGEIDRISYDYVWNWNEDGTPGVRFFADKIHHRRGFQWRHPCHETLYFQGPGDERRATIADVVLYHRADNTKSRGQYLPLLKMAVEEDPDNDRMSHYYGRELMFKGQWPQAIDELQRHLDLPRATWKEERCASMRYIARCFSRSNDAQQAHHWAIKATLEWPWSREPWMELAKVANAVRDWNTVIWACHKALDILQPTGSYMNDPACWGPDLYDLCALAHYYQGNAREALIMGQRAVEKAPQDQRLLQNLAFYKEAVVE